LFPSTYSINIQYNTHVRICKLTRARPVLLTSKGAADGSAQDSPLLQARAADHPAADVGANHLPPPKALQLLRQQLPCGNHHHRGQLAVMLWPAPLLLQNGIRNPQDWHIPQQ